jgi:hypothetical protein
MDAKYLKSNTDITLILTYATQISRLCENVIIDMQLTKNLKKDFTDSMNAALRIHKIIASITNYEMRKEIHERTTNNYDTGAFDNIMFTIGQMSDEQRNLADEVLGAILEGKFKINRENE